MRPTRDTDHAIVDVLDVILRDGAMVQADVIVTVADIPLIGINLRAAIAGMTTMTEYGFFENWDIESRHRSDLERRSEFGREPRPRVPLTVGSRSGGRDTDRDDADPEGSRDRPDHRDGS